MTAFIRYRVCSSPVSNVEQCVVIFRWIVFFEIREPIEDFVDFLSQRDTDRQLTRAAAAASGPAFAKVWDNPEDDVYDSL